MPIWKDIPGFEGRYQINDAGVVKYLATGQYLKPIIGEHGNPILCLHATPGTHTGTWVKIHQLVAQLFVNNPDPQHYHCVFRRDGNKNNNAANNLYWGEYKTNLSKKQRGENIPDIDRV